MDIFWFLKMYFSCYPPVPELQTIVLKKESLLLEGWIWRILLHVGESPLSLHFPLSGQSKQMFCVLLWHFADIPICSPECWTGSCLWHVAPVTSRNSAASHRTCALVQATTFSHSAFTFEAQIISFTLTPLLPVPISPHQHKQSVLIVYFLGYIHHIWLTENFTALYSFRNILYLSNIFFSFMPLTSYQQNKYIFSLHLTQFNISPIIFKLETYDPDKPNWNIYKV